MLIIKLSVIKIKKQSKIKGLEWIGLTLYCYHAFALTYMEMTIYELKRGYVRIYLQCRVHLCWEKSAKWIPFALQCAMSPYCWNMCYASKFRSLYDFTREFNQDWYFLNSAFKKESHENLLVLHDLLLMKIRYLLLTGPKKISLWWTIMHTTVLSPQIREQMLVPDLYIYTLKFEIPQHPIKIN